MNTAHEHDDMHTPRRRWVRTSEAAAMLGVSESTARRMANQGIIRTRRRFTLGEWRLYDAESIETLAGLTGSCRATTDAPTITHGLPIPTREVGGNREP